MANIIPFPTTPLAATQFRSTSSAQSAQSVLLFPRIGTRRDRPWEALSTPNIAHTLPAQTPIARAEREINRLSARTRLQNLLSRTFNTSISSNAYPA